MVIDYAFGGTDLVRKTTNIVSALGHHCYDFTFQFSTDQVMFRRTTDNPTRVYLCENSFDNIIAEITIEQFHSWLAERYEIDPKEVSFRSCISPFVRVWGRETLDVTHPLNVVAREPGSAVQDRFLGIMGGYGRIDSLINEYNNARTKFEALEAAMRSEIVPRIATTRYRQNQQRQLELDTLLEQLKANLAGFAISIKDILSKEAAEHSERKEALLIERARQSARLARFASSLSGVLPIPQRELEALKALIPSISLERLRALEDFHRGLTSILRDEIFDAQRETENRIKTIDADVALINRWLQERVANVAAPPRIINQLLETFKEKHRIETENDYYEMTKKQKKEVGDSRAKLSETRSALLARYADQVNKTMAIIAETVFPGEEKRPILLVNKGSIELSFSSDKGTGTAYAGLLILDTALLMLNHVPVLIEDSLLFSNVQPASMQRLIGLYSSSKKQIFMAADKVDALYGESAKVLYAKAVTRLSRDKTLYDTDWRSGT